MNTISYEPTNVTPYVYFNPDNGVFEIKGRSLPDTSILFYQPILSALENYAKDDNPGITANFAFEYFNTSSSKCLFDVFKRLNKVAETGRDITINWYFEEGDDDMMEAGEDYSDLLDLDFNFYEIEEDDDDYWA